MKRWLLILLLLCFFAGGKEASAETVEQQEESQKGEAASGLTTKITEEILSDMSLAQVQSLLDEILGGESFSVEKALKSMINGETFFTKEAMQEFLHGLFFDRLEKEKKNFSLLLLLILIAAVLSNFAAVFENGQVGEVSFYMIYLLLFTILMNRFAILCTALGKQLDWLVEFMKGLAPAYYVVISASAGTFTAAAFYEGVLILVGLIQWLLLNFLLPGANLYVLLRLVNHLSKEDMLSKMAEFLETLISWSLKTMTGAVLGLQVVRGLVTPAMDAVKRTAIGKTAGAIPAVGNAVNVVTELILTGAVLVKNCLGAAAVVIFLLAGAGPLIHYGMLSLSYRFLAAVSQPISDKRIVGCLGTLGEGCSLLLRILISAELLCILTFVILMASVGR